MFSSGLVVVLVCDKMQLKCSLLTAGKLFCPAHNFVRHTILCARQLQEMLDTKTDGLAECHGTK